MTHYKSRDKYSQLNILVVGTFSLCCNFSGLCERCALCDYAWMYSRDIIWIWLCSDFDSTRFQYLCYVTSTDTK